MNKEQFDVNLVPTWRQGYRFQFEPAQNGFVILYPEGMIKLNESAGPLDSILMGKIMFLPLLPSSSNNLAI
jgi:pyrroloquinoline quinone biosynthesis protein D